MANTDNYKILKTGISWSAFERFAVQGMQFVVFVFMARVLSPTDYGLVGMLAFFIVISQLIAEGGLSQAIIRKLDRDEADLSTSFYVNIAGGAILYLLLFAIAPLVSGFYGEPRLTGLLRVMALCIPIQSSLVVHRAVLTSRLDFKTQAKSTFVGTLTSGFAGIYMAYNGYGAWSIVCLQLTNQVFTAITLWLVTQWRPKLLFSTYAFRRLYGFGSKLLMSKVVDCLYNSFYVLAIGKVFSAYALGCYT
ncbi:MAG: oligosaccharide flippase family protein, partial [Muribaculaceae bacterium]|nr:oligosaccharide flippase family protein [Muribaculaceae bacterium]